MNVITSKFIVKSESIINEDNEVENAKYSIDKERKCGEVILLANIEFWFVCTLCDKRFRSVVIFQNHIEDEHITNKGYDFQYKDPLDTPRNEEIVQDVHTSNSCFNSTDKRDEIGYCNNEAQGIDYFISDSENETAKHTIKVTKQSIKALRQAEDTRSDNFEEIHENEDSVVETSIYKAKEDSIPVSKKVPKKRNRKKKEYSCSLCQHIARNKYSLEAHMISHHGTGTRHQCEECGKCFRNSTNLKSHLIIHSGTRPYKCDFCDSGFSHPNSLRTHRFLHTGERPHKCNQCDKGFVSSSVLKIHMSEHTGETPYVCQYCDKAFANKCHYNRHIISHSSRKAFECKLCDKAFKHRETYNKHMVCHTSEKKLVCDVCQKRFIHRKNLAQHKKIHLRVKQYICKVCNKDFAQNAGLYSHMKYHKNND